MTKLILSHNIAADKVQEEAVAVITVPFKKGPDFPRLPRFVQSCLPLQPKSEKEAAAQKPLSYAQVRRALKWFESLCRIESLMAATEVKTFVIENGGMIGSYLLGQINRVIPNANVKFHGFDPESWPLLKDTEADEGEVTIHVYHGAGETKVSSAKIPVFAERQKIVLPLFVLDALDGKREMRPIDRRKALVMYKYFVFIKVLEELGAKTVLLQGCAGMESFLTKRIAENFKRIEYINFPQDYFVAAGDHKAPSMEQLVALKEKFAAS